jgi:hypothetical protein
MKFMLRFFFREDLAKRLKRDASITDHFDVENAAFSWINSDDDVVSRIFESSKQTQGLRVYVLVELTKKELTQVTHYEVDARKLIKQPDAVQDKNDEYMMIRPYIKTSNRTKVRLRDKIFLKNLKLKEDVIASVEFGEAFLCSRSVSQLFKNNELTGYCEYQVLEYKDSAPLVNYVLLGANNVLPPLCEDKTIVILEGSPSDDVTFRRLGLASYSDGDLSNAKDFNFSGESYGEDGCGLLIVSSRVKDIVRGNKVKGIAFTPVLNRSTDLYKQYLEKFEQISQLVTVNSNNVIS